MGVLLLADGEATIMDLENQCGSATLQNPASWSPQVAWFLTHRHQLSPTDMFTINVPHRPLLNISHHLPNG